MSATAGTTAIENLPEPIKKVDFPHPNTEIRIHITDDQPTYCVSLIPTGIEIWPPQNTYARERFFLPEDSDFVTPWGQHGWSSERETRLVFQNGTVLSFFEDEEGHRVAQVWGGTILPGHELTYELPVADC